MHMSPSLSPEHAHTHAHARTHRPATAWGPPSAPHRPDAEGCRGCRSPLLPRLPLLLQTCLLLQALRRQAICGVRHKAAGRSGGAQQAHLLHLHSARVCHERVYALCTVCVHVMYVCMACV